MAEANIGAVARDGNVSRSPQHDEHRIALGIFLDDALAASVVIEARAVQHILELRILQAIEERFAPQDGPSFVVSFRNRAPARALQMNIPNWIRNRDALAFEFV